MTDHGRDSWHTAGALGRPAVDAGPLGLLPSLTRRQVMLGRRLGVDGPTAGPAAVLAGLAAVLGEPMAVDRFEVHWRGSGLKRPGVIAHLAWPRLASRVGIGIDPPLAHAMVDRLLGFDRPPAEGRLLVTPVEWGILSFLIARALDWLEDRPGLHGPGIYRSTGLAPTPSTLPTSGRS